MAIERVVRAYVAEGSGLASAAVIPGNDSGPSPTEPYATVLLVASRQDGVNPARCRVEGGEVRATVLSSIESTWSVQWYREGSRDRARAFRLWADSPLGVLDAGRRGLTFRRCSDVRQIDEIVSETWEERAGLDLVVGLVQTAEQNLGLMETVPVSIAAADAEVEIDIS